MRGGSLTRFRTDEWYDQQGKGLMTDLMRGGLQGLIRTRNPLKLPSNIKRGLETGLTRGIKRKAEDVLKKEITKQAKKALSHKNVKDAVRVATALFPKQTKRARDIRSNRGLSQWGGLYPFWKLRRGQRGGWLSPEVMRVPGFDLRQRLARRRYKNPSRRRRGTSTRRRRR